MKISRKELIQEIDEELLLREGIRKAISIVTKKRAGAAGAAAKAEVLEEQKLRSCSF